jgi:hypothetical protein
MRNLQFRTAVFQTARGECPNVRTYLDGPAEQRSWREPRPAPAVWKTAVRKKDAHCRGRRRYKPLLSGGQRVGQEKRPDEIGGI